MIQGVKGARRSWLRSAAVIGIVFGLITIWQGGVVLFVDGEARRAAGDYVPFVLWFNFLAGFMYVAAGSGLWFRRPWAVALATVIAVATLLVFAALGWHVARAGAYEVRTVVAMMLRTGVWSAIAVIGSRALQRRNQ